MSSSPPSAPSSPRRIAPIWWGVLLLLTLAPIPFGSNRPWAWSLLSLLSAMLLAVWAVAVARGSRTLVWRKALTVPVVIAFAIMGWVIVSILPETAGSAPIWDFASEQLGRPLTRRISISVDNSLVALMRLAGYIAIFWLSVQYCRNPRRAEHLLVLLSWSGLAFALYGLINFYSGNTHLLWFERWAGYEDVTATFVNRNHYATFAGLQLVSALGLGISSFRAAWRVSDASQARAGRIAESLSGRPIVYLLIAVVIATAWLQSHSRMGVVAVGIGIIGLLVLSSATGLVRRSWWLLAVIVAIGSFLFIVSGQGVLERFSHDDTDRFAIYSIVTDQISAAPFTGTGYGTFAEAFLLYRDVRLPSASTYTAAHNSYLELAAELGLPAATLAVFGILWCVALCLIGAFRRRRDAIFPIVAVAASLIVGVHAFFDFSVQIPAIAISFAALLGCGVAQSWQSEAGGDGNRAGSSARS